jgi:hypothetical protein
MYHCVTRIPNFGPEKHRTDTLFWLNMSQWYRHPPRKNRSIPFVICKWPIQSVLLNCFFRRQIRSLPTAYWSPFIHIRIFQLQWTPVSQIQFIFSRAPNDSISFKAEQNKKMYTVLPEFPSVMFVWCTSEIRSDSTYIFLCSRCKPEVVSFLR